MTEHALKVWPPYFQEVHTGRKTFEARRDDRGFKPLDILRLQEFDPNAPGPAGSPGRYTGRECRRMIGYILRGVTDPVLGDMEAAHASIAPGYVILSLCSEPRDPGADLAAWRERHGFDMRLADAGKLSRSEAVEALSFRLQLTKCTAAIVARLWASPSGPVPAEALNEATAQWSPHYLHAQRPRAPSVVRVFVAMIRDRLGADFIVHERGEGYALSPAGRGACREALAMGPPR